MGHATEGKLKGQDEELIKLYGFDILPGLEFNLQDFDELKPLMQILKEEFPGTFTAIMSAGSESLDIALDILSGLGDEGSAQKHAPPIALRTGSWRR